LRPEGGNPDDGNHKKGEEPEPKTVHGPMISE
jgi:hypothetical protein